MIQSYRDLKAYKMSYQTALDLYKEAKAFPNEELFGLASQVKRAATSIPLNIAEGYGKRVNVNEFKRFLLMAIGSCDEMKVLLDFCTDLGYISRDSYNEYTAQYDEIGKMLNGLYQNWK